MEARIANFVCYLAGGWLLSGRFLYPLLLACAMAALAAAEYGWGTIQALGIALLVASFLKISGLPPF
jgi:hypothetical protein